MIPSRVLDIAGERYGRLVVLEYAGLQEFPSGLKQARWRCRCDCGAEAVVRASQLRSSLTKSCGRLRREQLRTHGHTAGGKRTPEYAAWKRLTERPQHWHTFSGFLADVGLRPGKGYRLDRGQGRWVAA